MAKQKDLLKVLVLIFDVEHITVKAFSGKPNNLFYIFSFSISVLIAG